jgi:ribosomal-protein-alanine N-acetyltransferase
MFGRNKQIRLQTLNGDFADECAQLHAAAFPHPWASHEFERLIGSANAFGEAAFELRGRALLGFILSRRAADEAEVLTITVAAACRNQGIGARLLAANIASLSRHGIKSLFLDVGENNVPARRLYAAFKFVEVGRRQGYYRTANGKSATALTLRRSIE